MKASYYYLNVLLFIKVGKQGRSQRVPVSNQDPLLSGLVVPFLGVSGNVHSVPSLCFLPCVAGVRNVQMCRIPAQGPRVGSAVSHSFVASFLERGFSLGASVRTEQVYELAQEESDKR